MEYYRTLTIYPIGSTLGPHFTPRKYNIIASHCGSCYLALSKWIHSAQTTCGIFTIAWPLPCFIAGGAGGAGGLTWRSSSSLDWISIHSYTEYISIYVELLHVITLNITLNHIFFITHFIIWQLHVISYYHYNSTRVIPIRLLHPRITLDPRRHSWPRPSPVPERAQLTASPRPKSKRWFCIAVWWFPHAVSSHDW